MADVKKKKGKGILIYILTGVFLLILCTAVSAVALIKPYEKVQTYLNIIFMDDMKIVPSTGLDGLVIKENDIRTEHDSSVQTSDTGEILRPSFGEQYAVLKCDAIGLNVPVYWGSNKELLERGACQATSSKVMGDGGNAVISAHVNTFFKDLEKASVGDTFTLYTNYGYFTYEAAELVTFENTDKTWVVPTEDDRLTLYTCKQQVLGDSTTRVGVVCRLVDQQFYTEPATGEEAAE